MTALAAVVLMALASPAPNHDAVSVKGILCFVAPKHESDCRPVDGKSMTVAAADAERTFVWSKSDGKQVVIGVLPPKSERVDLTDKSLRDVTLTLQGDKLHGWPEDVQLHVTDANKKEWTWSI